jgi:signal transduction histidine kinase
MDTEDQGLLPQLPLDDLLAELQVRLDAVRAARDGLHALLDAVVSIGGELDLETVLRRIVEAAVTLVDARYGALGVIGDDGELSQFVPVGVTEEEIAAIDEWPHGRGLLGLLIKEPQTLRLANIHDHPESHGFPEGHPPMHSFLGVPIRVRDEVFGNLYLTEKTEGRDFDEHDESIVTALATAAGIAVENARLYAETRQREIWLDASSELTRALLSGSEPRQALRLIATRAREMSDAEVVAVAVPADDLDTMTVVALDGADSEELSGFEFPVEGTLIGSVFAAGEPRTITANNLAAEEVPLISRLPDGPKLLIPLGERGSVRGVLVVGKKRGNAPFPAAVMRLLKAFAGQAAIVLELGDARREAERYELIDDRARIARDLHDVVIQRLFATAMTLTGAARMIGPSEASSRVQTAVDDLDETIRQIRSTIFALQSTEPSADHGLRARVLGLVDAVVSQLGFTPGVRMEGLLDTNVEDEVADEVVAVLQEGLSNVVRHARASRVDVVVEVTTDELSLRIVDNGVGISANGRRSGLANLASRASRLGGTFEVSPRNGSEGTRLEWRVPLG